MLWELLYINLDLVAWSRVLMIDMLLSKPSNGSSTDWGQTMGVHGSS
jgi:hypothetical protein